MNLLAFELSTEACSVALRVDDETRARHEIAPRRHAELALPWAEALLAEAGLAKSQLDAIAVGRGPGAFTGVRLGISIAQGIALALDRPIVPVSTLAALAMRAVALAPALDRRIPVLAAIDARMNELYVGCFEIERFDADGHGDLADAHLLGEETLAVPGTVALPESPAHWYGVGTGFAALGGELRARFASQWAAVDAEALPQAADVARLAVRAFARGEAVAPERVEPAYLRNNVALTLAEQIAAREAAAKRE
ncbi:MAG: tRNA (adenosine(37)-N6)-threonylcarbamoyltransferase complex dimerization subunit type 1 TsaB [Lysobacter sp.]|nr:MAG: tRNA (adenosine(37)-N6)-threonylcarbamoyltransferase complex dimerization subunit type 1 TsaB [Lysobacter sp.]